MKTGIISFLHAVLNPYVPLFWGLDACGVKKTNTSHTKHATTVTLAVHAGQGLIVYYYILR